MSSIPLSYTQNLEDFHLALAFAGKEKGFYIDVGGGHAVADNVSMWFYERGWNGIVAEPQPELAALYPRIRPRDRVHRGPIGRENGEIDFFHVDRLHGFSTTVEQFANGAKAFGAEHRRMRLPVVTLAELCAREGVTEIDFLKIDVEGAEADVLHGNDWKRFRPKIVVAEAVTPGAGEPAWHEWEPFLLAQGYRFRLFDTLNRFYVADECPELFERLPADRAPWESATHMYEIGRAPDNAAHPDRAAALAFAKGLWATLPYLEDAMLAEMLAKGRGETATEAHLAEVRSEAFKLTLGRIACGYDGGQIYDD